MAKVIKEDQKSNSLKGARSQNNDKQELEDLRNRLARALADYQNLVKRAEREREEVYLRATRNFVEDLLPVIDDFERAQEHLQDQGLGMGLEHLWRVLDSHGVTEIPVKTGDEFNSEIHEAIDSANPPASTRGEPAGGGGEKNTIAQVLTKGYKWKDGRIIRPAKVVVYNDKQPS